MKNPTNRPQNNPSDEPFKNAVNIERTEYESFSKTLSIPHNTIHKYIFCSKSVNIEESEFSNFLGSLKRLLNSF
jgi:hypothetical protein